MKTNGDHPWMMSGYTTRKQAKNPPQKYREENVGDLSNFNINLIQKNIINRFATTAMCKCDLNAMSI